MKISIYTTLFQYKSNKFDFNAAIWNFSRIADEIVVATIPDEDDTASYLEALAKDNPKLIVVIGSFQRYTPTFDGDLKNLALQSCTGDILVQLDADEKISTHNINQWKQLFISLFNDQNHKAYYIPVINLFGSPETFSDIGQKWYIHKRGLFRGPVNFARKADGHINTSRSDTCELIDQFGNLVPTNSFFDTNWFREPESAVLFIRENKLPVIFHYGWIDLDRRIHIIKNHWQKQWDAEAGHPVTDLPKTVQEIKKNKYLHGIALP